MDELEIRSSGVSGMWLSFKPLLYPFTRVVFGLARKMSVV